MEKDKNDKVTKEPTNVLAVLKTMKIIEALVNHEKISLTELAKEVEENKSTVYRFLGTLIGLGYVTQDENDMYSITLKLFQLGMTIFLKIDLANQAMPTLKKLAALSEETVHLAINHNGQLVYLHKIESKHSLRVSMQSRVGSSAPKYCTGVGKVLLAWSQEEELEQYLSETDFKTFTKNTIGNRLDLENELKRIRERGYCFDDEEHEEGVRCIAAPIRDFNGDVIASISISGPSVRLNDERMKSLAGPVVASALEISNNIGYQN